jgi:predicted dehydrogenase
VIETVKPIRVGLVGYGFVSKTFHVPLLAAVPAMKLVAVSSSDAAKVHADLPEVEVVADASLLATMDGIDLVVVASPNHTHAPLTKAALLAGKDVVCDKPFTVDLGEARELEVLAEQTGRLLSVFHNRRWDSDYLGVKSVIDSGRLGRVTHLQSSIDRFRPVVRDRWRENPGPGTGLWFDLGPHLVDQALELFGRPEQLVASLAHLRDGALTDDWFHVVMEYERLRVILHGSVLAAGGSNRFVVHGDRGSLVKPLADRQEDQLKAGIYPGSADWGNDPDPMLFHDGNGVPEEIATPAGDQSLFYRTVADAIAGRASNPVPPAQAVSVMSVIEAAVRSAADGRAVMPF